MSVPDESCKISYLPYFKRYTVHVLKFPTLFSNKKLVIRAGIHIVLVRIANIEDPDQTASLEAV